MDLEVNLEFVCSEWSVNKCGSDDKSYSDSEQCL